MNFNPEEQFRCTIIRGKAKNMLDNLLPAYANIIDDLCPIDKQSFARQFNERLSEVLGQETTNKTLDNHRTEIAGKLFGMYVEIDDIILPSGRTLKYLEDSDQPAFFKDVCFKFQFPNGMDKLDKVKEKMDAGISIRQFPYILQVLLIAKQRNFTVTKDDIAYYVLNSLQVLQGKITAEQVIDKISEERNLGISRKVRHPGKEASYSMQHIREQLNYLELANLIRINNDHVGLNSQDLETIREFAQFWDKKPEFDVYQYDFSIEQDKKSFYKQWQLYYSDVNSHIRFTTSLVSLDMQPLELPASLAPIDQTAKREQARQNGRAEKRSNTATSTDSIYRQELGDEGESFVLKYERDRVSSYDPALVRKVIHFGKTRGLGYDIQSVVAENNEFAEFVKYIEVKATKRVTVPSLNDSSWIDSLNLTRNEWIAAAQHKNFYYLYRVYFTPGQVIVYVIHDPFTKYKNGTLKAKPVAYRIDFSNQAVDFMVVKEKEV